MQTIFYTPKMHKKPQDQDTFELEIVPFHVRCPKCGHDGWLMERTFGVRPKPPSDFKAKNEPEDGKVIYSEEIQLKKT